MGRQLRHRNQASEIPSSVDNPRPSSSDFRGHVSHDRHKPTIAPAVFTTMIVALTILLIPAFYYTHVLAPHPEATSLLSQLRIKGNILLSALGHRSSVGAGRPPFVSEITPKPSNAPTEAPVTEELSESAKLDDELGRLWKASSEYRRLAQKAKLGEYAIQGDGTKPVPGVEGQEGSIENLPEADADAKDGLTPEVWEAIKQQISADELTIMLDSMRRKEAANPK